MPPSVIAEAEDYTPDACPSTTPTSCENNPPNNDPKLEAPEDPHCAGVGNVGGLES